MLAKDNRPYCEEKRRVLRRTLDRKDERTVMKAARRTETDWSTMNGTSHRARASCPASGRGGGAFSSCQAGRARQTPPVCFPKLQRREQRPTTNAGQSSGRGGGRQRSRFSELTDTLRTEAEPEQPLAPPPLAGVNRNKAASTPRTVSGRRDEDTWLDNRDSTNR